MKHKFLSSEWFEQVETLTVGAGELNTPEAIAGVSINLKVASGGELSRFMLALKVALADRGSAPTLVFDEIDSGVGGAVADAIGKRLSRLSGNVQVLSVTHAPQVAARAVGHYLISKAKIEDDDRVATAVIPISQQQRLEEIARMLSGATVTDEARAAAEKLIEQPSL